MRWSERQLAMLREMGIRVWAPAAPAGMEPVAGATMVAERSADPGAVPAAAAPGGTRVAAPLASADWLIVGESFASTAADPAAAAEQELLLDNMLRAIRVSRDAGGRDGRACHLPLEGGGSAGIDAAIDAVRPRCILALGRIPATALLGLDEPLGKLRDRLHERGGIPVIVTFPLPYLLRHAADKPRAWTDLCRAVAAIA